MDRLFGFGPKNGGSIPSELVWIIGAEKPARESTIIFLIRGNKLKISRIGFVLEDFLEEEYNSLSYGELQEIGKIWLDKKRLARSKLFHKIEYCMLSFFG